MRQDVKLGLSIGGILLAVLIVYVLVVPGDDATSEVQLVDANGNPVTETKTADNDNTLDLTQPPTAPPVETARTETPVAPTETDPFEPGDAVASSEPAPVAENRTGDANHDWAELLSGQAQLPALMTETPTNANRVAVVAPVAPQTGVANDTGPVAPVTPSVIDPAAAIASDAPPAPVGVATTHVVQSGETLSSISARVYGSANYYPHLVRANPQINPNRLKVGTAIQVPALSDVRPASSQQQQDQATVASATINPTAQYKVAAGDSLYTISVKLYGKADRVDTLYQANKDKIGADPAKLKTGTVLTLPEPPSVATR